MGTDPSLTNPFDPFGTWRTTRDAYMETWSRLLLDLVNSEPYTETTSRFLDTYLSVSAPMRKVLESTMTQVLSQLNMPTRGDVISLAERLTNIEMRLDDMDAKLDTVVRQQAAPAPTPAARNAARAAAPTARAASAARARTTRSTSSTARPAAKKSKP